MQLEFSFLAYQNWVRTARWFLSSDRLRIYNYNKRNNQRVFAVLRLYHKKWCIYFRKIFSLVLQRGRRGEGRGNYQNPKIQTTPLKIRSGSLFFCRYHFPECSFWKIAFSLCKILQTVTTNFTNLALLSLLEILANNPRTLTTKI